MKRVIILLVLVIFLAGCKGEYYVTDTSESVETFKDILNLKSQLKETPDDMIIRDRLADQIFNLELERARAAGVEEWNEPFFIDKGSNVSILLIHGFTATPWEVRELGESLASKGYNVYGTLVAGHGTDRSELRKTIWRDWYSGAQDAYEALDYISKKVFVIGVSTGGSLGIVLAQDYKVDGIVCLGCPIYLKNKNTELIPLVKYFYWYEKRELSEEYKPYYYEYRPLESIEQLQNLISYSSAGLGDVTSPILIIQNTDDPTVDSSSADYIYEKVKSTDKQKEYLDGDYHVLTKGEYKDRVFELIYSFIDKYK